VWVNRRPVLDQPVHREAVPGDDLVPIDLQPEWNELLVKVDNRLGTWAFFLELRQADGRGPLGDVQLRTTPPPEVVRMQPPVVRTQPPPGEPVKFLRTWQLLGPLASAPETGYDKIYAPEKEAINLVKEYDGIKGKVRWKLHQAKSDLIDLRRFYSHSDKGVAVAVCWLYSEQKRPAVFSIGSDDGMKFWLERKLIFGHDGLRAALPGQNQTQIELKAGWQEVLVKVDNRGGNEWGFYLEVQDPRTKRPLPGLRASTTPPRVVKK
jgi:hypothetical protein